MGAKHSIVAIVPEPLELQSGPDGALIHGELLPKAYRHLSQFPVLGKKARSPTRPYPNENVTHFLKEQIEPAALIADFLSVQERLAFLQTHKVGLPPKLLKPLLFNGPSRELNFLCCSSSTATAAVGSNSNVHTNHDNFAAASGAGMVNKNERGKCFQLEVRYRGSVLSRAVPLPLVATALHRVIRSWLKNRLRKQGFPLILAMVNKLLSVFRPTEEVWYAIVNNCGDDGASLLTYACADPSISLPIIEQLLEIPCLDLGLPDRKSGLNAIQLAHTKNRQDLLVYFASLVGF